MAPLINLTDIHGTRLQYAAIFEYRAGGGKTFVVAVDEGEVHAVLMADFGDGEADDRCRAGDEGRG